MIGESGNLCGVEHEESGWADIPRASSSVLNSRHSLRHRKIGYLDSEPPCGGAAQHPVSMSSECQIPLKPSDRTAVAGKVRKPPSPYPMTSPRRQIIVSMIGDAGLPEGDPRLDLAFETGRCLIDTGFAVMTGGTGGVMDAAQRGGRSYREDGPAILKREPVQLGLDNTRTAGRACEQDVMRDDSGDIAAISKSMTSRSSGSAQRTCYFVAT